MLKSKSTEPHPPKPTGQGALTPNPHSSLNPDPTREEKLPQEPELIRIAQEAAREADKEPRGSQVDLGHGETWHSGLGSTVWGLGLQV